MSIIQPLSIHQALAVNATKLRSVESLLDLRIGPDLATSCIKNGLM